MDPILTIVVLLMLAYFIGLTYFLYRMACSQAYIELLLNNTRDYVKRLKVQLASVRHDMALDREGMDERFDEIWGSVEGSSEAIVLRIGDEHKKTRKDIQEVKTALRDDEKQDQRQKAKARRNRKKPAASK